MGLETVDSEVTENALKLGVIQVPSVVTDKSIFVISDICIFVTYFSIDYNMRILNIAN